MKNIPSGFYIGTLKFSFLPLSICIFFTTAVYGTTYYVSSYAGNDSNTGVSTSHSWRTLSKVNTSTFRPGDSVLFRRGDIFYGSLTINQSGTSGSPITYGAYGSGNKPIITGFTKVSGWTNDGDGIYSKVINSESPTNMLTIDGNQYAMGRWPNSGWNTITGVSGRTQISDFKLTSFPNWTGAEVVIRKNHWIIDKHLITNHNADTLTFASSSPSSPYNTSIGWGYFIQNSLNTLDKFGEWYYDNSSNKLYLYFGRENTDNHVVKVSSLDRGIYLNNRQYITIDNISFTGANVCAIYAYFSNNDPNYFTVQNCNITFSGKDAIFINKASMSKITNTNINYTNNNAIYFYGRAGSGNIISNNSITNTGTIAGAGDSGDGNYNAISSIGKNSIIEYNHIINTGYLPIIFGGTNAIVRNNFVDNYCYIKNDGGGIYVYNDKSLGKQVLDNIILNGIGAPGGTDQPTSSANGLYADGFSENILYSGNTVYNVTGNGFHSNVGANITIENNTFYQMPTFISLQRFPGINFPHDFNIKNNIFITTKLYSKGNDMYKYVIGRQDLPFYNNSIIDEVAHIGSINNNHYFTHTDTALYLYSTSPHEYKNSYSFTNWIRIFGYDANSTFVTGINDENYYTFEYNNSSTDKTIILNAPMVDTKGTKYKGSVILRPYTSIVLIKVASIPNNGTSRPLSRF